MSELDRITRLSSKLNKLSVPQEMDSKNRLENCDLRYRNLDSRFCEHQDSQLRRYNTVKEQVGKLQRKIETESEESNENAEEVFRKLKTLQTEYVNILNSETVKRKESDLNMNRRIAERADKFKADLAAYHKQKDDEMKELYELIEVS